MKLRLYYDTETTDLPPRGNDPALDKCPHVVQLAAILVDHNWKELHSCTSIIKPDNWTISPGAGAVHGITNEYADTHGIPGIIPFAMFSNLAKLADETVAHNWMFDSRLMDWEMKRLGKPSHHKHKPHTCTMLATTPILQLPKMRGAGFKWPKLEEAYASFFGEQIFNAHDALADVRACIRIHRHLIENDLAQP